MGEGSALASTGQTVKVSSPVGAILAIVGGAALFAGAFLPYAEGDSLASFYEGEAIQLILTYLLPPVLVIAAGVVGLSSPSLRQFAAGVAAAIGLTQLAGWVGTLISVDGVDWGIGLWAFMLGAGLSLAGGVILVVQARASATTPMAGPRQT